MAARGSISARQGGDSLLRDFIMSFAVNALNRGVRGELPAEIAEKNITKIVNERGLISFGRCRGAGNS
jgi:hypothetical protein